MIIQRPFSHFWFTGKHLLWLPHYPWLTVPRSFFAHRIFMRTWERDHHSIGVLLIPSSHSEQTQLVLDTSRCKYFPPSPSIPAPRGTDSEVSNHRSFWLSFVSVSFSSFAITAPIIDPFGFSLCFWLVFFIFWCGIITNRLYSFVVTTGEMCA